MSLCISPPPHNTSNYSTPQPINLLLHHHLGRRSTFIRGALRVTGGQTYVECVWNLMSHRDARGWSEGEQANGVGSQYSHTTSERGVSSIIIAHRSYLTLMRTPRLPVVDWTDAPADLNELIRFGERRNLVSARVPSRFKHSLLITVSFPKGVSCTSTKHTCTHDVSVQ